MGTMRTSFLRSIANGEEIRYSLYSSVTSCLLMKATVFAAIKSKNTRLLLPKGVKNAALLHEKSYPKHPLSQALWVCRKILPSLLCFPKPRSNGWHPFVRTVRSLGEASLFWSSHRPCQPRTIFFVEDQSWTSMSYQEGIEFGVG
jgi:hypothetical protein